MFRFLSCATFFAEGWSLGPVARHYFAWRPIEGRIKSMMRLCCDIVLEALGLALTLELMVQNGFSPLFVCFSIRFFFAFLLVLAVICELNVSLI